MKKCVHCGSTNSLTRDHIIPKWLLISFFNITGQTFERWCANRQIHHENIQILCRTCNQKKAGKIEENEIVRQMVREMIYILKKIA